MRRWTCPQFIILASVVALCVYRVVSVPRIRESMVDTGLEDWRPDRWDEPVKHGATGNLIFRSLAGLMQMAPNSKYPNGHSIVRASIATGTLLYHGRGNSDNPFMDWLAFDPEHSQTFLRGRNGTLFTFTTTRELSLIYFDGGSATKRGGATDTQDILIWGEVGHGREPWRSDPELDRIADACAWGRHYGIDGFVRMEYDFEIMYCDFTQGLALVSALPTPLDARLTPPLMEVRHAGSRHAAFPGESRVRVDPTTFVSFFDPALTSLAVARRGLERRHYRVAPISREDIDRVRTDIHEVLVRDRDERSGVDWVTLARVIQERFGDRLLYIRYLLDQARVLPAALTTAQARARFLSVTAAVRQQLMIALSPYMPRGGVDEPAWYAAIAHSCARSFTAHLPEDRFTKQERLIRRAMDEVLHEVCRVLTDAWRDAYKIDIPGTDLGDATLTSPELLEKWRMAFESLYEWLDWPIWMQCDPACAVDEFCEVPQLAPWQAGDARPRCIAIDNEWI